MKNISSIKVRPARKQVVNSPREVILTNEPKAGEKLVLGDLSARLGVPVTPIRKALQSLEREDLVQLMPHKGAVVVGIGRKYITDYYVTRAILEGKAAVMARGAKDMTVLPGHSRKMEQVIEEERYQNYTDTNYDLHEAVWILADSERMEGTLKTLFILNPLARNTSLKNNALISFGEHKEIVEAIQMRNKQDARKEMHAHMIRSLRDTLSKHEEQQEVVRLIA